MRYEYKVIQKRTTKLKEKVLNNEGLDGWELVAHSAGIGGFGDMEHTLIFKRELIG